MNAEIVAIGTEILLGEIVDTNSAFITRQLRDIGVNVYYLTTVGDNLDRIAAAIRIALSRIASVSRGSADGYHARSLPCMQLVVRTSPI